MEDFINTKYSITINAPPSQPQKDGKIAYLPKVFIGLLCYGGQTFSRFNLSLSSLLDMLKAKGIPVITFVIDNESLVTRGRNNVAAKFLSMKEYTHLLLIDVDISFNPQDVLGMLQFNKEIVCGCYPKKGIEWEKLFENRHKFRSLEEMKTHGLSYVINFDIPSSKELMDKQHEYQVETVDDRWIKVRHAGTGFMLINRKVFEILKRGYPERMITPSQEGFMFKEATEHVLWNFFNAEKDPVSGIYLSEDYLFCDLWRRMGGEIWIDLNVKLTHIGTYQFGGDFKTFAFNPIHQLPDENVPLITKALIDAPAFQFDGKKYKVIQLIETQKEKKERKEKEKEDENEIDLSMITEKK